MKLNICPSKGPVPNISVNIDLPFNGSDSVVILQEDLLVPQLVVILFVLAGEEVSLNVSFVV